MTHLAKDAERAEPNHFARRLLALAFLLYSLLTVMALGWLHLQGRELVVLFEPRGSFSFRLGLGMGVGFILGIVSLLFFLAFAPLRKTLEGILSALDLGSLGAAGVSLIALVAGFVEELFFRGALQPVVGLIPASLIFGLLHGVISWYSLYATLAGLVMGLLYLWSGDLWACISAHFVIDLAIGLWLLRAVRQGWLGFGGLGE